MWDGGAAPTNLSVDWVVVRQWVENPPTVTIGAEQTNASTPQWSANATKYNTPQFYNDTGITYGFQITWQQADNSTFTLGRPSGTSSAYTKLTTIAVANNSADVYWINFTQPQLGAAGTYNFSWTGWNNSGSNTTSVWNYVINKAGTTINLTINGTNGDVAYAYPVVSNATAWGLNTVTLWRNGTNVGNQTIQLAAKVYNYTASLSNENYSASQIERIVTISQAASGLSLTSSSGWTLSANQQTTITCSETTPYSATLKRDGVTVASPYSATLGFGTYSFNCAFSDGENYTANSTTNVLNILTGGFGCTNPSTYAYQADISTSNISVILNFTSFVLDRTVKADLSDVWVNTSVYNVTKNTTYGNLLRVNASSFRVKFGNYIGNNSYSNYTNAIENLTNFTYSEISPYYVINLIDEVSGAPMNPPQSVKTMAISCTGGASAFTVQNATTKFLIPTFAIPDFIMLSVSYGVNDIYSRTLQTSATVENRNMYVVDAKTKNVVELQLEINDFSGSYGAGSIFRAKKYLEGALQTISEVEVDAQSKVLFYLIAADKYQFYVDNGVRETGVGNLIIDTIDFAKTFLIGGFTTPNYKYGEIFYNVTFNTTTGVIRLFYYDPSNATTNVSFWVYNLTNRSQLFFYGESQNSSQVDIAFTVPDPNASYVTRLHVGHLYWGPNSFADVWNAFVGGVLMLLLPYALPGIIVSGMSVIAIISSALIFGSRHGAFAGIFAVVIGGMFWFLGFYPWTVGLFAIALFFAIINHLISKR